MKILVDTDILIDFTKGYDHLLKTLLQQQTKGKTELYTTPVIVAEFFTDLQLADTDKHHQAQQFINYFTLLPITKRIGLTAGDLLRTGHPHTLGDALIAATCLIHHLHLATRNRKHFQKIPQLKFYQLPDS
jgi:predicted nucleic acid-binding protein